MNKYSFLYPITLALFVPLAHAMEQEGPITPKVFTQEGKEYIEYVVQSWVNAAKTAEVETGLAVIFKDIYAMGIDYLINDQEVLKNANSELLAMQNDPVFKTLSDLQKINGYTYKGAKQFRSDISLAVTQAVALNVLVTVCPEFKVPPFAGTGNGGLITVLASRGPERIGDSVEFIKHNAHLDTKNSSYFGASALILGYLAQTGALR